PLVRSYRGSAVGVQLGSDVCERVRILGLKNRATPFMIFLASFYELMRRYTGESKIRVGTVIANRNHIDVEPLIGYFANTLVLRTEVPGGITFIELLEKTRSCALDAYRHQDLPFESLVDALRPERSMSETPLFQVMFVLNRDARPSVKLPAVELAARESDSYTAKFDLTVSVEEIDHTYDLSFEYDTDVFEKSTVERMLHHWRTLLSAVTDRPEHRVEDAPMLGAVERKAILQWSAPKKRHSRSECLHDLFATQVLVRADSVSVAAADEQLTYACLDNLSSRLANYLRRNGVGPENLVGICLDRSARIITAILGILKSGAGYVPPEPSYPNERLAYMVEDSDIELILTENASRDRLITCGARLICLDSDSERIEVESPAGAARGAVEQNV
ncbi:MAG: condensation domain-containing protein, partial [Blastocatellia bacterium]